MLIGKTVYTKERDTKGLVIDETKNTLLIDENGKIKRIIKDKNRFVVYTDGKTIKIRGSDIVMRPWEYAV
jgi:RNase P/RNase MRP subunit p29